jgi:hypothetical protein
MREMKTTSATMQGEGAANSYRERQEITERESR